MNTTTRATGATSPGLFGATPGLAAFRVLRTLAVAREDSIAGEAYARAQPWLGNQLIADYIKAGVPPINSVNSGLVSEVGSDLMMALRPMTIWGRLPGTRRLPARIRLLQQVTPFVASWIAEGNPVPMSGTAFTDSVLDLYKDAALTVVSNKLLREANVDAERGLLADLLGACAEGIDRAFLDPSNAGVPGERPASITNGVTPIVSGGASVAAISADLKSAVQQLTASHNNLVTSAWTMSTYTAVALSLLRGSGGAPAYPDIGATGGTLAGLPVLTSSTADPEGATTRNIALIDGSEVGLAWEEPSLRTSTEGAINMSGVPGDTGSENWVSLFQSESTALLVSVRVGWRPRRRAAAVITGVPL